MGASVNASQTKSSSESDTKSAQNEEQNSLRNTLRTSDFNTPEGQQVLNSLIGQAGSSAGYGEEAAGAYRSLASDASKVNPEVENIIRTGDQAANSQFSNRLAQSRAGGFRGGTGANLYNQDKIASEFTNQQENNNSNLRYGAFNDAANRATTARVGGASGLAGLSNQGQSLGAQILSMLRGEKIVDDATAKRIAEATSNTKASSSSSTISGGASYGV